MNALNRCRKLFLCNKPPISGRIFKNLPIKVMRMEYTSFGESDHDDHDKRDKKLLQEKTDHLTRTSSNTREMEIHDMKVSEISTLSPTVKEIVLRRDDLLPPFPFEAGQWVDVFIPGVETVGGFSMCSSPQELVVCGTLRLAIKYSDHPPAYWMHKSCKVGSKLKVRIGGDFYLKLDDLKPNSKILLIAGGVGINPISSIIRCLHETNRERENRVCLLYSANSRDELLFKDIFEGYKLQSSLFRTNYFLTGKGESKRDTVNDEMLLECRRIQRADIIQAAKWLLQSETINVSNNIVTYLCGPSSMIKTMEDDLNTLKFERPKFEQWW